jgi:internalin A
MGDESAAGASPAAAPIPQTPRHKFRLLRFSLRTLLVLTLVIAIACGWVGNRLARKRREATVIEGLSSRADVRLDYREVPVGGSAISFEPSGPEWLRKLLGENFFNEVVEIDFHDATDDDLKALSEFKHLAKLSIFTQLIRGWSSDDPVERTRATGPEITDAGLEYVGKLTGLQNLDLTSTLVTDAGLRHLSGLTQLGDLTIHGAQISSAGLAHLHAMVHLERLALHPTRAGGLDYRLSDNDLAQLSGFIRLRHLHMDFENITDAGLAHLAGMSRLEDLFLNSKLITDVGLAHLHAMSRLKSLNLSSPRVTDSGLACCRQMGELSNLSLNCLQVTGEGLKYVCLRRLIFLSIYGDGTTAEGLAAIEGCTQLEQLGLSGHGISDAALAHIKSLPRLKNLRIWATDITDPAIELLGELPLDRLYLNANRRLTDAALERLQRCRQLTELTLAGSEFTGSGLRYLQGLPRLTSLTIESDSLSDAELEPLKNMTQLRKVHLPNWPSHGGITQKGFDALKRALPNCQID